MLLQRLVEFAETSDDVVPAFYARKPVRWILNIGTDGVPSGFVDTADRSDAQRKFGAVRLVPAVTRTVGIAPALGTDNGEYVFGWVGDGSKPERVAKQYAAFRGLIEAWAAAVPDGPAASIAAFYRDRHDRRLQPPDGYRKGDLIGFRIAGVHAAESPSAQRFWAGVAGDRKGSGESGLCMVCARTHSLLKTIPQQIPQRWLPGATQGASLVSVNEAVHGYGLQKFLTHTPICADCGLKFMTALTSLLSDPQHSTTVSGQNARLAWWVLGGSTFDPWSTVEQPDPAVIAQLLASPARGAHSEVDDLSRYCAVTVGGNVARVVVRDWVEQPLPVIKENIRAWFDDYSVVDVWTGELAHPGISHLVRAAGRFKAGRNGARGEWVKFGASGEDRPTALFHDLINAAILGRALPPRMLGHVISRIRADGRLDAARVGLIRLALRRRLNPENSEDNEVRERLTPELNEENTQPAYVSGRIFAVMDDLQRTVARVAEQNLNTTISERYFSRAIDNPQIVLISVRRTTTAWLKRLRGPLRRPSWSAAYEHRLDELYELIDSRIDQRPGPTLLADKGQFILGFHHQRAALRAERRAAAKKKSDLPPQSDDEQPTLTDEGEDA